jgi:hypothetical protein
VRGHGSMCCWSAWFLCESYVKCDSARKCHRKFRRKCPGVSVAITTGISRLINKVRSTGSLLDKKPAKKTSCASRRKTSRNKGWARTHITEIIETLHPRQKSEFYATRVYYFVTEQNTFLLFLSFPSGTLSILNIFCRRLILIISHLWQIFLQRGIRGSIVRNKIVGSENNKCMPFFSVLALKCDH